MKILGHEFLPELFQFTVCKTSHSTITQFHIHTVQFCSPTVIPCSYTIRQSYTAVIQLYNYNLQLYISTVEPCRYRFKQSYTAGWQLCHNAHLHLSTVTHCSYTVLQSLHAVTQFYSHFVSYTVLQSFCAVIKVLQSCRTVTQFYSQAVLFHSSTVMRYIYIFIQSFPTVLKSWCLIQGLSMTTALWFSLFLF